MISAERRFTPYAPLFRPSAAGLCVPWEPMPLWIAKVPKAKASAVAKLTLESLLTIMSLQINSTCRQPCMFTFPVRIPNRAHPDGCPNARSLSIYLLWCHLSVHVLNDSFYCKNHLTEGCLKQHQHSEMAITSINLLFVIILGVAIDKFLGPKSRADSQTSLRAQSTRMMFTSNK